MPARRVALKAILILAAVIAQLPSANGQAPAAPERSQLSGHVVDAQGNPVKAATVRLGTDRFGTRDPVARTDDQGNFILRDCKPGKTAVTVQAENFAPQLQDVAIDKVNAPLEFKLQPGHTVKVRVVDGDGNPLKGVMVLCDTWRGRRTLELSSKTNAEGRVQWDNAPEDVMLCDVLLKNFMSIRRTPITADPKELVVTLKPELNISGVVVDKGTGKPIPEFQIRVGQRFDSEPNRIFWPPDDSKKYKNGMYNIKFNEPDRYILQVVADGYQPLNSRDFYKDTGEVTFDFKLEMGTGPFGIVLLPDEKPAEGAEVAIASNAHRISLNGGHFERNVGNSDIHKTDALGQFTFPPPDDNPFMVVIIHEAGYAQLTGAELEKSTRVTLQPWGKIEGKVMIGNQPDAGREVSYMPRRKQTNIGALVLYDRYDTKADAEGNYHFDRVVPGPGVVARVVVVEQGRMSSLSPAWQTNVEVKPGETMNVPIGGSGRAVIGQLVTDRKLDAPLDWAKNEPISISGGDAKDRNLRYMAAIDATGHFKMPDVPAGKHQLSFRLNAAAQSGMDGVGETIGSVTMEITVPEVPAGQSNEPFDLGNITVKLLETLDPGKVAPEFVVTKLGGDPSAPATSLRMSDFNGKVVLLDFWNTNTPDSADDMTVLRQINGEFGKDPRFVLIGLSCDENMKIAQDYLAQMKFDWLQAYAGNRFARTTKDYFVRIYPATFLIGPDGRILARDLHGNALKQAVATALKEDNSFKLPHAERPPRFPVEKFEIADKSLDTEHPAVLVVTVPERELSTDQPRRPIRGQLRALDTTGKELWKVDGLNVGRQFGYSHGVAVDPTRERIYISESVDRHTQLEAYNLSGKKMWQISELDTLPAVDPKTGNLRVGCGLVLNVGETVVFDPSGKELASYPIRPIDLTYDPHDDAFWLVGYHINKIGRDGKVLFEKMVEGWTCRSVTANPTDGSVWISESGHPDVAGSKNRMWLLNADGSVRHQWDDDELAIFNPACDPRTGKVWVATSKGLCPATADGKLGEPLPIKAVSLSINPTTGDVWVTTKEAILKLDSTGKTLKEIPFENPTSECWIQAF